MTQALNVFVLHVRCIGDLHHVCNSLLSISSRNTKDRAKKIEILMNSHVVVRAETIRHVPNESLDLGSVLTTVHTRNKRRAGRRSRQSDEDFYRRGFSSAIWPYKTQYLTSLYLQRQIVQRQEVAISLGQILGL